MKTEQRSHPDIATDLIRALNLAQARLNVEQCNALRDELARHISATHPTERELLERRVEEASEICGCDESKAWRNRALGAELALRYARGQLNRLLDSLDRILNPLPGEDIVGTDGEVIGQTLPADNQYVADQDTPGVARKVVNWMAERIPTRSRSEKP